MQKIIYLARHGEYLNPNKIIPYRLPGFPLTKVGQDQADLIGKTLRDKNINKTVHSPIERCVETASIINKYVKTKIQVSNLASETLTPLQGLTKEELAKLSPDYPFASIEHQKGGGETPEEMFTRMKKLLDSLIADDDINSALIVSHGDPIVVLLLGLLKNKIPHTHQDFDFGGIRYIPMGGLVKLTFDNKIEYKEII